MGTWHELSLNKYFATTHFSVLQLWRSLAMMRTSTWREQILNFKPGSFVASSNILSLRC